jgi:hypothetical protein
MRLCLFFLAQATPSVGVGANWRRAGHSVRLPNADEQMSSCELAAELAKPPGWTVEIDNHVRQKMMSMGSLKEIRS